VIQPVLRLSAASTPWSFLVQKPPPCIGHWGTTVPWCTRIMPVALASRPTISGSHPVRTMSVCRVSVWMRSTVRCAPSSISVEHTSWRNRGQSDSRSCRSWGMAGKAAGWCTTAWDLAWPPLAGLRCAFCQSR